MSKYGTKELNLLNIQIGFELKLARLKKRISQEELGLSIDADKTKIARLERNASNWNTIYLVCQELGVDFQSLFKLKTKKAIISLIDECKNEDTKLTTIKVKYYEDLKKTISRY